MILIDSSVWVSALRHRNSPEAAEVARIVRANVAVTAGVIIGELLQGAANAAEFNSLERTLAGLHYEEITRDTWRDAGGVCHRLRKKGVTVPLLDALLAVLAIRGGHVVYTLDAHFRLIPNLHVHKP
ncbi:MAG: PIN domain-containing protein [Dehalococcoidia bacterium]|nr:PIN domain-containing protein [Dehalococcoidia bacterium]